MSPKYILHFFNIILLFFSFSHEQNSQPKYFFTMYLSHNNKTPYLLHAFTPYAEHLTINLSEEDLNKSIKKEIISDYVNSISSIIFYKEDYLIKTCFGTNKIVEIIPLEEINRDYKDVLQIKSKYIIYTQAGLQISQNLKYCYSTVVSNPDSSKINDQEVIITYWVEINSDNSYTHKALLFYPIKKQFSKVYTLKSNTFFHLNKRYPLHCTTFRSKDIFCSYYDLDLNNQYVIETDKLPYENINKSSVYFVLSDIGFINGKNMLPISLNRQQKSILGGYYDVFLAEFSERELDNKNKNNTVILYSLYRKSLHASLVPMYSPLDLFFGISIKDDYIETNLFNYLLEGNEMVFIFIYNNMLQAIRVDYSKKHSFFKKCNDFRDFGYYSSKIDNCKNPKFMQSSFVNTTIKYTQEKKAIVVNSTRQYIYEKDIVTLISCEAEEGKINYIPKIIVPPQCLIDLDALNSHEIHKINFYLDYDIIIYDIYDDIRLKSFRDVGIMFYEIEPNYKGLIINSIKLKSKDNYIFPQKDTIYYDITHIKFQRIYPNYVPYFTKPFHLKYRLFNKEEIDDKTINKISSSLCFFQIKFFPFKDPILIKPHYDNQDPKPNQHSTDKVPQPEETDINDDIYFEPDDVCNIAECSLCVKTDVKNNYNGFICQKCDSSQLEVMIPDTNIKSETYGACICNISLGFKKDPIINTCYCQEDNAYYKSTNLCWPLSKLESGPYYTDKVDDITEIPIYDDCYSSCAKCSKGGNETNHNCDKCKEGFVYINNVTSNCYNKSTLDEGFHEVDKDHYIKCHQNCISCIAEPSGNKQYCTECRANASYFIRENQNDNYFNCFSEKCDSLKPNLLYKYDINSKECVKNCNNGVKIYNNLKVCLTKCSNDFPYLDQELKICYDNCEKNPINKITNIAQGTCVNEEECKGDNNNCGIISECKEERKYKNKEGKCMDIPDQCLLVDFDTGLCKICNNKYYPLKEDINLGSFNCYKNIEEIIKDKNKSNYYLNETEKYWDKCYPSCETCYAYGSENRQRCSKCKPHYHMQTYLLSGNDNIYNNCLLDLTPNENCTSSQIDMHKYKDFCHLCQTGYAFINGLDKCFLEKELSQGPYYSSYEKKLTGNNREKTITVKVYYNCYKNCKTCESKGDFYDNQCKSCIDGYIFNPRSKFDNCISPLDIMVESTNIKNDYNDNNKESDNLGDNLDDINSSDLIKDNETNTWFNLGKNSFYIYQQNKCYLVFYHKELILISNKESCNNICPIWNITHCPLKKYERFKTITKTDFNNLLAKAKVYSEIRDNINIFISEEKQRIYFHLTNNISPSPKNISYIDLSDYEHNIKSKYGQNLLLIKADIKRIDTQSTQVEYQFFDPNDFTVKINLEKNIVSNRRRLNNDDKLKINIELPVDWTQEQKENINYLFKHNIDAFNSSSDFYTDNCNQFTSSKGNDVFLEERKKKYYPDIALCEEGCTFVKYNKDTEKVTCKCNYKTNSDNYTNISFVKKEKDKKFLKDLILENIQAMKCVNIIFKGSNLKSNAGFIIMIIFLILFTISSVLYYLKGGFDFFKNFLKNSIQDKGIIDILKSSINLVDIEDKDKDKNQIIPDKSEKEEDIDKVMDGVEEIKEKNQKDKTDIISNNNDITTNKSFKKDINKDTDIIKINDTTDKQKTEEDNQNPNQKEKQEKNLNDSYITDMSEIQRQKVEGIYDRDSNLIGSKTLKDDSSQLSKNDNISYLVTGSDNKSDKPNQSKKFGNNNKITINSFNNSPDNKNDLNKSGNKKNLDLIISNDYVKSSDEHLYNNKSKMEERKENDEFDYDNKNRSNKINIKHILNMNDDLLTLKKFSEKYNSFISIYLADLRKYHILYFSFSCPKNDIDNIYLKLSLFAISIVLYLSLNTLFLTNSKMSNAYFDFQNSGPIYIIINLFLPFVICNIIILILKYFIMPNHYMIKIIRTIQDDQQLKESTGFNKLEEIIENDNISKEKKIKKIKNFKFKTEENYDVKVKSEYNVERKKLEYILTPLSPKYRIIVIIYFLVGFIFMGINWYMLTSFCSVYINTGKKLFVNSLISILTSFILSCILGLIPALIGLLAIKLNNTIIFKVYKFINKVI